MRRWGLVLLLLLSLGVNLGVAGMLLFEKARQKPPAPPPAEVPEPIGGIGGGDLIGRLPRFADILGLEGQERQKFLDIHITFFQDTTRLRLLMAEAHRNLQREMSGEKPDAARVDRLLREEADVYLRLEQAFAKCVLASRQLLGADEERRYLQVVGRLRGAARGPRELAPPPGEGGPDGMGPEGPPNGPPLDERPGIRPFRQNPMRDLPPRGGGPGWQGFPGEGGGRPQGFQPRQPWRRMQRGRPQQGRQPGKQQGPPPPESPPPPVY